MAKVIIGPGDVFTAPLARRATGGADSGWTFIGRTEDGVTLEVLPDVAIAEEALAVAASALAKATVTLTVSGARFIAAMDGALRWLHDLDQVCCPRMHRRCHVCHPTWSRPLAVNGNEYRRRQQARRRRNRQNGK